MQIDSAAGSTLALTFESNDRDATRMLTNGMLAALAGGSVIVRQTANQWIPDRAVYRVTLTGDADADSLTGHSWHGTVVIHGTWEAPGWVFVRSALGLVWREAGF